MKLILFLLSIFIFSACSEKKELTIQDKYNNYYKSRLSSAMAENDVSIDEDYFNTKKSLK